LLLGSAIALTLLFGGAGALLFFWYSMSLPGLLCFWIAGLCLLLMSYPLFILPGAVLSKPSQHQPLLDSGSASGKSFLPSASLSGSLAAATDVRVRMSEQEQGAPLPARPSVALVSVRD
jgi:hypothetical protein